MFNEPLLLKTLEHIKSVPQLTVPDEPAMLALKEQGKPAEGWYQSDWAVEVECGTAYCFAGWAALLSGHHIKVDKSGYALIDDNRELSIRYVAMEELGIDIGEADDLFDGTNDLDALEQLVEYIIAERAE